MTEPLSNPPSEYIAAQLSDSKAWLASVIGSAMDAIVTVDETGQILVFNQAAEKMFRLPVSKAIGKPLSILIPEADLLGMHAGIRQAQGIRSDGERFPIEASIASVRTASDSLLCTLIIRDVTEREATLAALRQREDELYEAQRVTHVGSWSWDLVADKLTFTPELFRIFGLEPSDEAPSYDELRNNFIHEEDRTFVDEQINASFETGTPFDFVYRLIRPTGEMRYLRSRGDGIVDENGKSVKFFGTALDITDQVLADAKQQKLLDEVRERDDRLNDLIANIPGIVWETSRQPGSNDRVNFVSAYVEKMLGYTPEEWLSTPDFGLSIVHPDDREMLRAEIARRYDEGTRGQDLEFRWLAKSSDVRWAQSMARMMRDNVGEPIGMRGVTIDITDRKIAEERISAIGKRYRLLFEASPLPMWVYDTNSLRFLEVNDAAIRNYGYTREEFLSMSILEIRPPEEAERLAKALEERAHDFSGVKIWTHRKKDGTHIKVEVSADSIEFNDRPARLVLANEVTERVSLEAQLRQAQKMEAIGLLAGGIAHDFNNLLTAINGYSELLQLNLPPSDPSRRHVDEILKAGNRAAVLTRQLLAFGRKQVMQPRVIDLNEIVIDIEQMLRRLISENIVLQTVLAEDLGTTTADPGQLEQALVNLVVNARDAMPGGGRLIIETKNVYLDEEYSRTHVSVKPGHYVMIGVSDNGIGMDTATRDRIFEPFFSTKESGKGTGLGLSTTYGIVKQTGGNIWVYSELGKGSTFKIYLPRAEQDLPEFIPRPENMFDYHGTETILLTEDEAVVRNLALQVLELYGYRVLVAESGPEALDVSERFADKIDLLITDVVMPGMSGGQLADLISASRPSIKILFMSGYTDNGVIHQSDIGERTNFIQKPFSTESFAMKIREILDLSH